MEDYDDTVYEGSGPSLEAAFEDAWHSAKRNNAPPGRYKATVVGVDAENPIHSYIVTIGPGPPDS
ncbi:MAG TPA: hypothetical protein VGH26_05575 [Gaiellaceae bacterium]|jgi:hypothetical protein